MASGGGDFGKEQGSENFFKRALAVTAAIVMAQAVEVRRG